MIAVADLEGTEIPLHKRIQTGVEGVLTPFPEFKTL